MEENQPEKLPVDATPQGTLTGLKKRQQVERSNKLIFLWAAGASVIISLALVAAQFLFRLAYFNQSVISDLSKTNAIIVQNITNADQLKKNVDGLLASEELSSVEGAGSNNLQVILDALPTSGDATTFSNSLYSHIIIRSGIAADSIRVGDDQGVAGLIPATTTPVPGAVVAPLPLAFSLSVSGSRDTTKKMLENLEKMIRPVKLNLVTIKSASGNLTTTINGETYYLPASSVGLKKVTKKP